MAMITITTEDIAAAINFGKKLYAKAKADADARAIARAKAIKADAERAEKAEKARVEAEKKAKNEEIKESPLFAVLQQIADALNEQTQLVKPMTESIDKMTATDKAETKVEEEEEERINLY